MNCQTTSFGYLPFAVALSLFLAPACGGDDDDDAAGDFTILDEGEGPANTLPLRTLSNGDRFRVLNGFPGERPREVITRGPFQLGDFEVYRDILDTQVGASMNAEVFHVEDENGVWLVGGSEDGLLPGGILTVPTSVRLGMRWKSSPGASFEDYTFEVADRQVLDSGLGEDTVHWLIGQIFEGETEPAVYRWYLEGWGQRMVANHSGVPQASRLGERIVPQEQVREATLVTEFDLTPANQPDLALTGNDNHRLNIMRGIRSVDGAHTNLSFVGNIDSQNQGIAASFTYAAGDGSAPGFFARRAFASWNESLLESRAPEGFAGYYAHLDVVGNAIYTAAGLFASTTDHVFFENAAGGVNGFRADIPLHNGNTGVTFLAEETVVEPGFVSVKGQLWGGSGMGGRPLQGATSQSNWHYGLVDASRPAVWMAETENIGYGKVTKAARFIDNLIEPVSTLTTATGDVHYIVSATGFVDRIAFGADGATRESLGRARVPVGHTLRGAVELGDGFMALATHETSTEKYFLWVAKTPQAAVAPSSSGVSIENWGFDVRVCWGATDEELDTSGWSLGGVPALATLPVATNCALVLRDLEARPMPKEIVSGIAPPGWRVVEGPVPGVGRVRGLPPDIGSGQGPAVAALVKFSNIGGAMVSAWTQGGGFTQSDSTGTFDFGSGGLVVGAPALESRQPGLLRYPAHGGEGVWGPIAFLPTLETDGSVSTPNGYVLAGPEPRLFPFVPEVTTAAQVLRSLNSGGLLIPGGSVLAESEHLGLAILRPDGSIDEIEHPTVGTTPMVERANGELCGVRLGGGMTFLYCATPAGVVREAVVAELGITDLFTNPVPITPLPGDRIAVVRGTNSHIRAIDFETLEIVPYALPTGYEESRQFQHIHLGPDGLVYVKLMHPNNVDFLVGVFTAAGFVAAEDVFDVQGFFDDAEEAATKKIQAMVVTEALVYLQISYIGANDQIVRIPRATWDAAIN